MPSPHTPSTSLRTFCGTNMLRSPVAPFALGRIDSGSKWKPQRPLLRHIAWVLGFQYNNSY